MSSAKGGSSADVRPLSPHLQVYSMRINMLMSIVHRITGSALYFGTVILVAWLIAAAMGPDAYDFVAGLLGSWLGLAVLFLYTWALMHHMMGGIRHFIWDTGLDHTYDVVVVGAGRRRPARRCRRGAGWL
jgi:succinate dehydrogenase / fumarate reductase cytochrome b subunit